MEIPADVLCAGSKSLLQDPVTDADGQTYSYDVAITILSKNRTLCSFKEPSLFPNNSAKQRVEEVRMRLAGYWDVDRLKQLSIKQLADLMAVLCDPVITERAVNSIDDESKVLEMTQQTIKICKRRNNIKVLYKLPHFRPYICVVCSSTIDQQSPTTRVNGDVGHVNCVLTEALRQKDFMVVIVQDCHKRRAMETSFLPTKGFICLDNHKKRPLWMKDVCMSVRRIMCLDEDVDVWYHPLTSNVIVTNVSTEHKNIPYVWLITPEDDLKCIFSQVWHKKNYIHLVITNTADKQLIKEVDTALSMVVKTYREIVRSVVRLCYT